MSKNNAQNNALRSTVNPKVLAYLDAVINEQDVTIDTLLKQNTDINNELGQLRLRLQKATQDITDCRQLINDINNHLDDNASYSLTKSKVIRLMKKLELL